jgi:signal transduction histidine kinase
MSDAKRYSRLKHDLANPLSAILAETQLLLLRTDELPDDVVESLRAVETGALRMREMLRDLAPD